MARFRKAVLSAFLVMLAVLTPAPLAAQSTGTTTGDLKGRVTDEKGIALPRARLTAIHRDTRASRSAVSDSSGAYELPLLPPGLYRVRVEPPDSVPAVVDPVRVTIGTTTTLDVVVRPPIMAEAEVVVGAEPPLIDPQKTDVATAVDTDKIRYLPSLQRNYLSFSLLTPRVSEDRGPQSGAAASSGLSINGSSPRYNYLAVDGFDNNDVGSGGVRAQFSQEAVQEYEVITNPYAAEYGRLAGGVVNIVTRAGTNDFKAGIFGFYRSDALSRPDPLTGESVPLEDLRFGASVGGPLARDRTFFFAAYERVQTDTANPVAISDADVALIRSRGFEIENGNVPYRVRGDSLVVKLDHAFDQSNAVVARGNWSEGLDENQLRWGGLIARSGGGARETRDVAGALGYTAILGSRAYNELRALYSYNDYTVNPLDPGRGVGVTIPGVATFGTQRLIPQPRTSNVLQLFDSFSYQPGSGALELKAGADYYRVSGRAEVPVGFAGYYRFSALPPSAAFPQGLTVREAFAAGVPALFVQAFGDPSWSGSASHFGAFAQAEIRPARQLLLRLGARYDVETPVEPYSSSSNWSPRASFSWAPTDTFRVTGGYGRFTGMTALGPQWAVGNLDGVKVRTLVWTIQGGPSPAVPWNLLPDRRFPDEASAGASVVPPLILRAGEFQSASTDMANLSFELEIERALVARVDGVWARGRHVFTARDVNPITNPDGPPGQQRPDPRYSSIQLFESVGNSWYEALSVGAMSRPGGPFAFSAFYTYADAEDDYLDYLPEFQPQDPLDLAAERGPSSQSPKHKVTLTGIWSSVGRTAAWWVRDWAVGLSFDLKAGLPYTVYAGYDRNRNGDPASDRPPGVGRNSETLPTQLTLDLRVARTVRLGGTLTAELVVVCTNLTDHRNVREVQSVQNLPSFGQPTLYGPGRLFQVGARLDF
ncbi:MAG: TonB-dependent receptor [Acidobacteria bacterium]|nr:MAG: TonB-dependent receptor [Acidobacteriota bacterium]MCE7956447.1 TonB-dependent receptor [Acidobacteria bacterium ACB2]